VERPPSTEAGEIVVTLAIRHTLLKEAICLCTAPWQDDRAIVSLLFPPQKSGRLVCGPKEHRLFNSNKCPMSVNVFDTKKITNVRFKNSLNLVLCFDISTFLYDQIFELDQRYYCGSG
jgi:hypothetical protein